MVKVLLFIREWDQRRVGGTSPPKHLAASLGSTGSIQKKETAATQFTHVP